MKSYGTLINIDGERLSALKSVQDRYESAVVELLQHVSRFKVGWHVLNAIKNTRKQVLIRPQNEDGPGGAYTFDSSPIEIDGRLYPFPHRFGEAFIYFNPESLTKTYTPPAIQGGLPRQLADQLFAYDKNPKWKAEDILVHELFHALRTLAIPNLKHLPHRRIGGSFVFVEELYAILVTNMYRSEQQRDHQLRGSWESEGFETMSPNELAASLEYGFWLDQLERQMPEFTAKLRVLPVNFNPFRANAAL